ncbi:ABC transporter substrate-binding protein [Paractinoplanes abujensis]|uniref:Iron complex transport system substrate-binding protein n=1 Tax=Paractinoplanes abujensis TaxID=882441 RepID=A0A7W7CWC6_9ACTN|nr:ABC transporter substrate-binding protein [Actinoplanes abujensis]MBB4695852.1 iron complex transport system substrate-binding protein [Actinoplanes abujensis]GID23440.1 ABC transporter substrate-binding protein [Actinoplanes abujensis]
MKRVLTAALAATTLLVAGACGGNDDTTEPSGTTQSSASAAAYPVTVGDLTLDQQPQKIVSLSSTATEILFAIGAGPQVTAVDDQSNYPADAPKTDLSGFKPNAEAIAAKDPDLVILSNDIDKIVSQLDKLKIPVFVASATTDLDGTYQQIGQFGSLTGHTAEADALSAKMTADIDKIVKDVPPRSTPLTYYYELDPTLYSVTSKTFIGSIFAKFGMTNVADAADPDGAKGGYPQLSQESLVKSDPDTIFLADSKCCQQSPQTVAARKGWSTVTAVKSNQIYALDDDIASRWGPRTVDLVRAIADAVAKIPA